MESTFAVVPKQWSLDQLLTGIGPSDGWRVLRENRFRVDLRYLPRTAWVAGVSVLSGALSWLESARYGSEVAAQVIDPAPIFVLGHWRSGTTHLHNLLGRLPGHTYSTVFQAVLPGAFVTADAVRRWTDPLLDDTRSYDAVAHGWDAAAEDEIALAKLTGLSPYLAFMFPDRAAAYARFVDFEEATLEERTRFGDALEGFVRKLMWASGGERVVVKSCAHSARIPLILERFPNARFVVIHRHPYEVFASTLHMRSHTDWENFFHLPDDVEGTRQEQTLELGARVFERMAADRALIPEGQLAEVRYDALCGAEVAEVERMFDELQLGDFEAARPALEAYVAGLKGYRTNRLALDPAVKQVVADRWRVAFEAFGYRA